MLLNGLEGVARVGVDIVSLVLEEERFRFRISGVEEVGFSAINAIDFRVEFVHPAEHVIKGAILHDKNDNDFDGRAMEEGRVEGQ